jgi:hypothetical protein
MIKPWFFLHIDKRKYLKKKIIKESCRFGIQIVKYNLFIKNYCNFINKKKYIKEILSAIDFIHAVSALLDYEFFKNKKKKSQNFPKVFNSFSDYKKLKIGLEISQKIQKFVSKLGKIILSKKLYIPERLFNYTFLKNIQLLKITYEMLKRLTFYFMLAFSHKNLKKKKFFFFIIPGNKKFLLTGFLPQKKFNLQDIKLKKFKKKIIFLGASIEEDGFYSIEIKENDEINIIRFLRKI